MASRYDTGGSNGSAATRQDTLSPNAPVSNSTSNSTQNSSSSSFSGLTGANASALGSLVNTLLYGTATPKTKKVYYGPGGVKLDASQIRSQQQEITGGSPAGFNSVAKPGYATGKLRVQTTNGDWLDGVTMGEEISDPITMGGTEDQKKQRAALMKGIQDLQSNLGNYSAGAAEKDSALAMQGILRQAMEQNMPAINRAIENAGTSGGAQEALLSQDLASRTAEQAATLAAKTKTDYGQVSAQLNQVLTSMAGQKDPVMEQLINALGLGRTDSSSSVSSGSSNQGSSSAPIGANGMESLGTVDTSSTSSASKKIAGYPEGWTPVTSGN